MLLNFTKMQGCGNDYIYVNCMEHMIEEPEKTARIVSDRRFGIGSDGLVLICPSVKGDAKMRMFNADGSEGRMCGNASRCIGKFLYDKNIIKKERILLETLSGIKVLNLSVSGGKVRTVSVDMDKAILEPKLVPVNLEGEAVVNRLYNVGGEDYYITCVNMGSSHCVIFCDDVDDLDFKRIGPLFERNEIFPDRVNTEFVQKITDNHYRIRIWERGSDETFACGSGACAAAVAACLNGHSKKGEDILIQSPGGSLVINYTDETVRMTGPAETVFEGVMEIDLD